MHALPEAVANITFEIMGNFQTGAGRNRSLCIKHFVTTLELTSEMTFYNTVMKINNHMF